MPAQGKSKAGILVQGQLYELIHSVGLGLIWFRDDPDGPNALWVYGTSLLEGIFLAFLALSVWLFRAAIMESVQ